MLDLNEEEEIGGVREKHLSFYQFVEAARNQGDRPHRPYRHRPRGGKTPIPARTAACQGVNPAQTLPIYHF
jgi:hypothetical protein